VAALSPAVGHQHGVARPLGQFRPCQERVPESAKRAPRRSTSGSLISGGGIPRRPGHGVDARADRRSGRGSHHTGAGGAADASSHTAASPARYAARVRPLYPARNPANASRSVFVNTGTVGMRAADGVAVGIGHLRGFGLRPEAGPAAAPADNEDPTVRRRHRSRQVTVGSQQERIHRPMNRSLPTLRGWSIGWLVLARAARFISSVCP
jgi:hypothetical protein